MDLIEAEEIKKKWQECTETYTKKVFNDPDIHGWCSHLPRARHPGV